MYIIIQIYFMNKFKQFLQCIMKQNLIEKYSKLNKREERVKTYPIDLLNLNIKIEIDWVFTICIYVTEI